MNQRIKVTVPPIVEPVSTADAKSFLRVTGSQDDTLIDDMVKAARQYIENQTKRALISQTLEMVCDGFPASRFIYLERATPLVSVTSIDYLDSAGASQTLSSSKYTVDTYSTPGRVSLKEGQTWPTTDNDINTVTITYVAGSANVAALENSYFDLVQCIKALVASWFENRESFVTMPGISGIDIPDTVTSIINQYRVHKWQ